MDTEALKAFIAVTQHRSFSLAGKQLHLTQPAISKRIAKLEEQLDHKLFDRLGRDLQLTEAGAKLFPQAEQLLLQIRNIARDIQELSGEIVGTLRVATSHHVGLHHLPPILREFASTHPNVNLQFDFLDSEQAHSKVLSGECELAFVTLAPKIDAPLASEVIWEDPLSVVVGSIHPLAKKMSVTLKALAQEPAILPDLNTYTGRIIKQTFEASGLNIRVNMATNYLETIKMMVSVGLGWSILPTTLIDSHLHTLNINEIKLSRNLGIVFHKQRTLSNAARTFLDAVHTNA